VKPPLFEILAYEPTELGTLCLRRRELLFARGQFVTEVTLNNEFLMSSYLTVSERALAEIALEMQSRTDLSVLVGGLGLGYTTKAALGSDRVTNCDVVEFLPQVAEWMKVGLVPLSDELNADERLNVMHGDVYQRLACDPLQKYDLILIDVDHSPDENLGSANNDFYTAAGLRKAKQHLVDDGVLGIWSYAESSPFVDALHDVFGEVRIEPITAFNELIKEEQTDWLFFARECKQRD
jgi:spermidine synthase